MCRFRVVSLLVCATSLVFSGTVRADDVSDPDPLPEVVPAAQLPAAPVNPSGNQVAQGQTTGPYWAPGGDMYSGMRVGSPYYWSPQGAAASPGTGYYQPQSGWVQAAPGMRDGYGYSVGPASGYGAGASWGYGGGGGWGGGSMEAADPYTYHFGPGFHRQSNYGHYRFPFHSYRAPWYFPGPPSYNRDTNFPW